MATSAGHFISIQKWLRRPNQALEGFPKIGLFAFDTKHTARFQGVRLASFPADSVPAAIVEFDKQIMLYAIVVILA